MFCFIEDVESPDRSSGRRPLIFHLEVSLMAVGMAVVGMPKSHAAPGLATQNGLPEVPHEYVPEIGAPAFVYDTGPANGNPSTPVNSSTDNSSYSSLTGSTNGGSDNGGASLDTMLSKSWGTAAQAVAQAMGINPSALAATCMMESGCSNAGAASGSSASGAFQMINSTYTADINQAVASGLVSNYNVDTSLAGKMDPANEAIAASQDLKNAATRLQSMGISNPTVLDTRAVYQFGAGIGPSVAKADASANLNDIVGLTAQQLQNNGLTATTTVGQWRATVAQKLGNTANQVVLASQ
ncbi:hypothetical protein [Beijerinckia indica]|uniref:Transglycosylase SLT domain-containing protein n=1 Tax=Beijerinckia indica subsp. indica (strain ATCC 9039 / DSM 1715 / NCIMB 8712) TaxID=395963 RepID=B2IL57_BEII9|nr:hypothetical protein [Beijerinckia indica]ACB97257.1 hypothetical protein Bind_3705 [Beijerinckia indica subsp. indica ATCC 9039]